MTDREQAYFDGFEINEGAYFYKRNKEIDAKEIKKVFSTIRENAHAHKPIVEIIREKISFSRGRTALCSLKVFKDETVPSFIRNVPKDFQKKEVLICYFLLIEIEEYLVMFTRHANGLSSFKNQHAPIMGNILAGALVDDNTLFTQMRMGNMSLNQYALRNKSYESDDLRQAMPVHGSGRQILKSTRIQNNDDAITLGLSTSRVSKIGSARKDIKALCEWADEIITGIKNPYDVSVSLMGHFATPVRWKDYKNVIVPAYLLIDFHELRNHIQADKMSCEYKSDDKEVPINFKRLFAHISSRFNGCKLLNVKTPHESYECEDSWGLLEVALQKAGMRLKCSGRLDSIYLVNEAGEREKLVNYINRHRCFYIGFDEVEYIYQGNQLHKDTSILNGIESIMSIFKGVPDMKIVKSEKGSMTPAHVDFEAETVFHVVEDTVRREGATHIVCDDMGFEAADHIVLSDNKISFIHSKAKGKPTLSASDFQVVIGQALKNIGNMRYMKISDKVNKWRGAKLGTSNINVCREGDLDTFEETYRNILLAPNGIKEVCLAVDFVSKKALNDAFVALRNKKSFKQKHSVSQLIWLLSAFISSCKDADMQCRILCRE